MSETFTLTGNRGLDLEEKLIFEQNKDGRTAVDLPDVPAHENRLGAAKRKRPIGLPGLAGKEPGVIAVSVVATLALNFYFLPPVGTLTIAEPQNWIALFAFLVVAVIASQLSATSHERAREAIARRNEVTRLFDLTRDVLLTTETTGAIDALARHIARRGISIVGRKLCRICCFFVFCDRRFLERRLELYRRRHFQQASPGIRQQCLEHFCASIQSPAL